MTNEEVASGLDAEILAMLEEVRQWTSGIRPECRVVAARLKGDAERLGVVLTEPVRSENGNLNPDAIRPFAGNPLSNDAYGMDDECEAAKEWEKLLLRAWREGLSPEDRDILAWTQEQWRDPEILAVFRKMGSLTTSRELGERYEVSHVAIRDRGNALKAEAERLVKTPLAPPTEVGDAVPSSGGSRVGAGRPKDDNPSPAAERMRALRARRRSDSTTLESKSAEGVGERPSRT